MADRPEPPPDAAAPSPGELLAERVRIVLVHPLYPGNVGASARAMANMGLGQLTVVDPPAFDMDRARWMATGGAPVLESARFVGSVAEAVADCRIAVATTARSRRWDWPTWEPDELARRCFDRGERVAVLFGREDSGLDNASMSHCQAILRIPTAGVPSLNLSQAVLLVARAMFAEARRRGFTPDEPIRQGVRGGPQRDSPAPDTPPAPAAPLAAQRSLVEALLDLLEMTAYMPGRSREQVQVTLSNILHRAAPTRRDLNILRGMVSKTRWSVLNGPSVDQVAPGEE